MSFEYFVSDDAFSLALHWFFRGSCGVFTIKAIEELAFGGDIYEFRDDHVQTYREKLAIEFSKKCWTVTTL